MGGATLRQFTLAGVALFCSFGVHAQTQWNTMHDVLMSQSTATRVIGQQRVDASWRGGAAAERVLYGIPGDAGAVGSKLVHKGLAPAGEIIDVEVKRILPWKNIARAVAKSLPLISTAVAIKDIADSIRCREAPGGLSECDPGTPEAVSEVLKWSASCFNNSAVACTGYVHGSRDAAADAAFQQYKAASSGSACKGNRWEWLGALPSLPSEGRAYRVFNQCPGYESHAYDGVVGSQSVSALSCPPVVVNGVSLVPVKGPDGKCATNIYQPASEDDVATKAETWGDKAKAPLIVGDLYSGGKPIDHAPPELDPVPSSINGPRETTTHPDGSTTVRDTRYDFQPGPARYDWSPVTTTKDYPPGATIPPPGAVTDGTTTTGSAPKEEIITCGLPSTPPCKIDETGTPSSANIPTAQVDAAKGSALGKITELGTVQAPAWTWSFALPTGCQAMTVGPFAGRSVTVDLCAYQSMIHDLASLIWAAFTIWACVGMVGRTFASG
jgi:hypothetical protein